MRRGIGTVFNRKTAKPRALCPRGIYYRCFELDISQYLCQGENSLQVAVTNTLANALTEEKVPSGLYGPVVLK